MIWGKHFNNNSDLCLAEGILDKEKKNDVLKNYLINFAYI